MAQRDQSPSQSEALLDSCSKRTRPIAITSIAILAGMTPVAMG